VSGLVAGQATTLLPGLVRVVAPNASFMTGAGTNSYLLGGRAGMNDSVRTIRPARSG